MGGDKLDYHEDTAFPITNLLENEAVDKQHYLKRTKGNKILLNLNERLFLATFMRETEYMKIYVDFIPEYIIIGYNLREIVYEEYVYIRIKKGKYGLKHVKNPVKERDVSIIGTSGWWKHITRSARIVLCIDDFECNVIATMTSSTY